MNKLWTIIKREYLVRVKSKSFILATLLTPLAFGAFFVVSALIGMYSKDKDKNIFVYDPMEVSGNMLPAEGLYHYKYSETSLEESKRRFEEEDYDIMVELPEMENAMERRLQATYRSKEKLGINSINTIEKDLAQAVRKRKIEDSEIDQELLNSFKVKVSIENADYLESDGKSDESKLNSIIGSGLGFFMGFLMYLVIFVYGGMVMRSVMEEKINRIVEVIISSVRPFQLMLGKIIGVGAVGLSQILFWIILIPIILFVVTYFLGADAANSMSNMQTGQSPIPTEQLEDMDMLGFIAEFKRLNWALILPVFLIFFLGGYFIYSSLFAAMGAAMGDDMGESQSLMIPIVIPVVLAFVMLIPILENPNGNLAIFGSLFPLFSPILMPARLAFDPPWWQILISIVLLILTVIGMIWVAGKIYRTGILLYGKKINLKEIGKWLFYKA